MNLLNHKKRRYVRIFIIVLIILLFFLILNTFSKRVRNFTYFVSSPIQKLLWKVGERSSQFLEPFFIINKIKNDNSELILKNQQLLLEVSDLEQLKQENQVLRDALSAGFEKDFELITTSVISKDNSEDYILLNKGAKDGINIGMPVINEQRVLFGKVSEIYSNFSRVVLISDESFTSDVKIQDKNILGVVRGVGNLGLHLELIPRESDLKEGDILMTSNLKGSFPKSLLIGQVSSVKKEDTKSFQEAEVTPFADLKSTDTLFVITNFKN